MASLAPQYTIPNLDELPVSEVCVKHSDMPAHILTRVTKYCSLASSEKTEEREIASSLKAYCDRDPVLNPSKEGVWQCIVGRRFACCVTQEGDWLAFINLVKTQQNVLIFRSR